MIPNSKGKLTTACKGRLEFTQCNYSLESMSEFILSQSAINNKATIDFRKIVFVKDLKKSLLMGYLCDAFCAYHPLVKNLWVRVLMRWHVEEQDAYQKLKCLIYFSLCLFSFF